jgi:transcription elongation factor Elf1
MTNESQIKIFDCLACGEPIMLSLEAFAKAELVTCPACGVIVDLGNVPKFKENQANFIKLNNYKTPNTKENNYLRPKD